LTIVGHICEVFMGIKIDIIKYIPTWYHLIFIIWATLMYLHMVICLGMTPYLLKVFVWQEFDW
jgi:hypothetical protein